MLSLAISLAIVVALAGEAFLFLSKVELSSLWSGTLVAHGAASSTSRRS